MEVIGHVASVIRYPVKSMAGESRGSAYVTQHGIEHDRLYAFQSSGAPAGMLRLTSRERAAMLQYNPRVLPDGAVEVQTPTSERFGVESSSLLEYLQAHIVGATKLWLTRESSPQTDVRPLSLLSVQTVDMLSSEFGQPIDPRRFRANLLLHLDAGAYAEETFAGRRICIGSEAKLLVRERTPRCRFITYDPDAPLAVAPSFSLMKLLDRRHEGRVGVYASVLTPGWIRTGDEVQTEDVISSQA